jgi:3-hydroxyacyl-[acyl-carrier-protein] dehydratase
MFARLTLGSDLASDKRMSVEEIERKIPHRAPMLLIDEIVSNDESSIVCRKTFRDDEFFLQGHFPGQPIVPGVIQCECCLQTGALLLSGPGDDAALPVATRMDAVKFKRIVRPGDTVEIQVKLNEQVSNAFYMTGKMMLAGKLAMRLDFACSLASAADVGAV